MFEKITQSSKDATKGVQHLLNVLNPSLRLAVDGVVGEATSSAYHKVPPAGKALVDELANARNPDVIRLLVAAPAAVKVASQGTWLALEECQQLIRRAVASYGEIEVEGGAYDYLTWLLDLEPTKSRVNGVLRYFAESRMGSFRGLYQLGNSAYADVVNTGRLRELPIFAVAAFDPWWNTAMALVYSQILIKNLRAGYPAEGVRPYKGKITREILYGAHNQGAVGLLKGARNALFEKKQSAHAMVVIARAVSQLSTT